MLRISTLLRHLVGKFVEQLWGGLDPPRNMNPNPKLHSVLDEQENKMEVDTQEEAAQQRAAEEALYGAHA
eukprot:1160624-Pelagomonas_calceolata.AAC.4